MASTSSNIDAAVAAQREEVVKMIKNTPIDTYKFDSEILSTLDAADNRYRWYLCTQTSPVGWTCERKNAYEILGAAGQYTNKSTTAIPVYKFIPSAIDTMIVRRQIRSMTNANIIN